MLCPEAAQVHVRRALEVRMRLTFGEDLRLHNGKAVDLCLPTSSINGGGGFIRRIRLVSGNSAQQALAALGRRRLFVVGEDARRRAVAVSQARGTFVTTATLSRGRYPEQRCPVSRSATLSERTACHGDLELQNGSLAGTQSTKYTTERGWLCSQSNRTDFSAVLPPE